MTTQITLGVVERARSVKATGTQITQRDITAFTCGSCYQLAEAIHDATEWPVYAFWDAGYGDYDIHAFVKTPRGTFLDVLGEHTRNWMLSNWEGEHIRKVRAGYDMHAWDVGNPFFDSAPRAREIAPLLIADYLSRQPTVRASEYHSERTAA